MILKASQRGGARQLALHLLKEENEHVEVHEISGFMSTNLAEALHEAYAVSKGTQCRQYLFSLSLNPPDSENVPIEAFEEAIDHVEQEMALAGQPRAIVFHEKEGRRHCHVVWSRINSHEMKAINLPFFKEKLMTISREQYLKHGWKMPEGLAKKQAHDPTNYTLAEHQQAKRTGSHAREIKIALQDAWAISDNKATFEHALRERGYWLARGDRRSYVAIDHEGEIYSIPKQIGLRTKDVRQRLGRAEMLRSVDETKAVIAKEMAPALRRHFAEAKQNYVQRKQEILRRKDQMTTAHRASRQQLLDGQRVRWQQEHLIRQQRFKNGLAGLWSRINGNHKRFRLQNQREIENARQRDSTERYDLITQQLSARRKLQVQFLTVKERHCRLRQGLLRDIIHHTEAEKLAHASGQIPPNSQKRSSRRKRAKEKIPVHEQDMGFEI